MRAPFRVFVFLLLTFGSLAACLPMDDGSSDLMIDVPDEIAGEDVSQPDSNANATGEEPSPQAQPAEPDRCGNCDPEWQCCIYRGGCFYVSPDGQHCV